jgi:hypothetical protein
MERAKEFSFLNRQWVAAVSKPQARPMAICATHSKELSRQEASLMKREYLALL